MQLEVDLLTWSETDWLGGGSQMCVAPACCSCPILLLTVSYHAPSLQLSQLKPAGQTAQSRCNHLDMPSFTRTD